MEATRPHDLTDQTATHPEDAHDGIVRVFNRLPLFINQPPIINRNAYFTSKYSNVGILYFLSLTKTKIYRSFESLFLERIVIGKSIGLTSYSWLLLNPVA
jgi:hypothetical protein